MRVARCTGVAHDLTVVAVRLPGRALDLRRGAAILAALVVLLALLPNATVCVGSDGHLAVEPLGADCGTESTSSEPSLHGCTDTLLGTATLQGQSDPGRRELCAPAHLVTAAATTDPWFVATGVPPDVPRSAASIVRCTVLLL